MKYFHSRKKKSFFILFREDETGEDVRYYSTLDQFDALLSCLDEAGPEKLLVYRLQKRYNDIARCMQITADLQLSSITDSVIQDDDTDKKLLSMFTDGLIPCYFENSIIKKIDYEDLLDKIKLNIKSNEKLSVMFGQIDGIIDDDDDDDDDDKDTKSVIKKREFFVHSTNNFGYSSVSQ